jgi:hypothetical protein
MKPLSDWLIKFKEIDHQRRPTLALWRQRPYVSRMCNDYEQQIRWAEYRKAMQTLELGMPTGQSESDLPRADHIRIGDVGPVMRAGGNVVELILMRFGFPPPRPRAAPVFNFRSEGRRFHKSERTPSSPGRSASAARQCPAGGVPVSGSRQI